MHIFGKRHIVYIRSVVTWYHCRYDAKIEGSKTFDTLKLLLMTHFQAMFKTICMNMLARFEVHSSVHIIQIDEQKNI